MGIHLRLNLAIIFRMNEVKLFSEKFKKKP